MQQSSSIPTPPSSTQTSIVHPFEISAHTTDSPPIDPLTNTRDQLIKSHEQKTDWRKVLPRGLAFVAGIALSVLTALAIAGVMATPIGWAIAGAVLLAALIIAVSHGGIEELKKTLLTGILGFMGPVSWSGPWIVIGVPAFTCGLILIFSQKKGF